MIFSVRATYFYAALCCLGLLIAALYMQYVMHLQPCPLCVMQRLLFTGLMVMFLIAAIHHRARLAFRLFYSTLLVLLSGLGLLVAGRQIWLQHLPPDQIPECGPGLSYLLENFPLWNVIKIMFAGSGDCARVEWSFLGLSLAEWSFLFFAGFMLLVLINTVRGIRIGRGYS